MKQWLVSKITGGCVGIGDVSIDRLGAMSNINLSRTSIKHATQCYANFEKLEASQ